MWTDLPFELLAHIFSFLPLDTLACAKSACKSWHTCAKTCSSRAFRAHPPWFLAMHTRDRKGSCYAHNPVLDRWHVLPLDFPRDPVRPVGQVGGLILCRPSVACSLRLTLSNPFARKHKQLPPLITARANPAVGVVDSCAGHVPGFQVYVAGGGSVGGASSESTLEMYDSRTDTWRDIGPMPMEIAVRLTVWTPNESVYADGILYWMTSARAYSLMGFEVGSRTWREVEVPMADRLECAAIVRRMGRLAIFGGTCEGEARIWELGPGNAWTLIDVVPRDLGKRFLRSKGGWGNIKCVGCDEAMYLYRDLGWGMLVSKWVPQNGRWEWLWVDGCNEIRGGEVPNVPIKGILLHPTLDPF